MVMGTIWPLSMFVNGRTERLLLIWRCCIYVNSLWSLSMHILWPSHRHLLPSEGNAFGNTRDANDTTKSKAKNVGSLPNLPRGFPLSNQTGKSSIDAWQHFCLPERNTGRRFIFPGHSLFGTYCRPQTLFLSGTCCRPTIQLPQIYPIQNILSTDQNPCLHGIKTRDSNCALDQVPQVIIHL